MELLKFAAWIFSSDDNYEVLWFINLTNIYPQNHWLLQNIIWSSWIPKPWSRKVRLSSSHLLAEIRTIHGTWYTSNFFRNNTFLFLKIESWNFQHLLDLGFRETLQTFSSFRQTFRWHFCIGNKELSKLAEILWGFTKP